MSFLQTVLLVFVLSWSWCAFKPKPGVSDVEHTQMQFQVKGFIKDYVMKNSPEAENIQFSELWSENLKTGRIKVHFKYTIVEKSEASNSANVDLSGAITLSKDLTSETNQWNMEGLQLKDETIQFNEPLVVEPGDDDNS